MQDDAFLVHARLGSGTTGAAFRATRPSDGRQVLLKALHADLLESMDLDHLRQVCQALKGLNHHAVASGVDLVQWRGDTVLIRDMIRGVDLATIVAGSAPPKKVSLLIGAEIAGALAAVHQGTGFHHGDLKPSNVFIDIHGDIRVVDFGMARALPEHQDRTLTMFHGSVGFISPERADNQIAGAPSDTYSLMLMLAWLFTGEMPRRTSANPKRHANRTEQMLERVRANGGSEQVLELLRRGAAYDPSARPPIAEIARTLAQLAEGTEGPAVATWAGPLVQALVIQPNEVEVSDVGQPLSAATGQPAPARVGRSDGTPVQRIRTGAHDLPDASGKRRSRQTNLMIALGAVLVVLAIGMLAGAVAIATNR